jgi:hypothetical protein
VTESKMASWWTPTGWLWAPRPPEYEKAMEDDVEMRDWAGDLRHAGYNCQFSANEPDDGTSVYHVTTWINPGVPETGPHLFVEIWDCDGTPAIMFVSQQNIAPFFFDKLPELIRNQRDINAPSVAKALVAFVRHGHGPLTISEYGDENKDERQRRVDQEARDRQRKTEADRKSAQEHTGAPR